MGCGPGVRVGGDADVRVGGDADVRVGGDAGVRVGGDDGFSSDDVEPVDKAGVCADVGVWVVRGPSILIGPSVPVLVLLISN